MKPWPALSTEFRITPFQERILRALEGRALHTEDLVREVGDAQQFFSGQGGIWELRHWGLVVHDGEFGNYRPDRPPADMAVPTRERLVLCAASDRSDEGDEYTHSHGPRYHRLDRLHARGWAQRRHSSPPRRGRE